MPSKQTIATLLLLTLALLTSWYVWQEILSSKTHSHFSTHPDAFATNGTIIQMNEDGTPYQKLHAPLFIHYPNNIIDITSPHFTLFKKDVPPWDLYAQYGQLQNNDEILQLWGNVKLVQLAGKDNLPLTLTTPALAVYPKAKYAYTQQPVIITQPGRTVLAIGLRADLNTHIIDLLSQVRGEIQPSK